MHMYLYAIKQILKDKKQHVFSAASFLRKRLWELMINGK